MSFGLRNLRTSESSAYEFTGERVYGITVFQMLLVATGAKRRSVRIKVTGEFQLTARDRLQRVSQTVGARIKLRTPRLTRALVRFPFSP